MQMLDEFFIKESKCKDDKKKYFVVRSNRAGVFYGEITGITETGSRCEMSNARRIFYWDGAASLSQLSIDGVSKPENCKFPESVPEVTLFDIIEVLSLSEKARASLDSVEDWKE